MGADRAAARRVPGVSLVLGLLAALLPKCPLCIATWLSLLGFTAGVAGGIGTMVRPLGTCVAVVSLGFLLARRLRRRR
ncbi:hypothetical protein LXT21_01125 [Myxococcus sp. K38C18041901]|uniref:hypothetical protein n=1 Tax=Myxococcus guangdongensis TaxID=2906760 RepID=UPI0020A7F91F|nr:hypothetical protein [Myxococcus guangdongensis]MCP3057373.1 hypothetical protein [Myxococcus guangdongensis]